jgi:TonB family protein
MSAFTLPALPDHVPRSVARLAVAIAVSSALHVLTVLGMGPLSFMGDGRSHDSRFDATTELAAKPDTGARSQGRTGEAGIELPAPEKWYTAREVDQRAEPLTPITLRYPDHAREQPVAGVVRLRLYIDEYGTVRRIRVTAADPPGVFEENAKKSWEAVRFSAARKDGRPVKSQKVIELSYQP